MLEIYVSTDVETDGPLAGKHSMLSLGSAAYSADKQLIGTFSANFATLPSAKQCQINFAYSLRLTTCQNSNTSLTRSQTGSGLGLRFG